MPLDRGTLTRIDHRAFVELDHSDGVQVVKVPVSDALWSTWRRYCDVLGITMGQAVADLIGHELATVVDEAPEIVFDLSRASQEQAIDSTPGNASWRTEPRSSEESRIC
jgi:hypothetical protein